MAIKILNRLFQSFLVLVVTGFLAFAIMSFAPDPVDQMAGDYATEEDRARLRAELGFDRPFLVQYGDFIVRFVIIWTILLAIALIFMKSRIDHLFIKEKFILTNY